MFEMLQQFEDALVQYDELDALFTQYVLNFGAGGTSTARLMVLLKLSVIQLSVSTELEDGIIPGG